LIRVDLTFESYLPELISAYARKSSDAFSLKFWNKLSPPPQELYVAIADEKKSGSLILNLSYLPMRFQIVSS
jgi:hypothetical protein